MLRGGNPLTVGVGIVIEVIRKNNSDYDIENAQGPVPKSSDPIYLGTLLRQFALNVPKFMELIQGPGSTLKPGASGGKRQLKVAFGEQIEPLGFDRFKTCELMAELLHCSNMSLLNERGAEADVKKRDADRDELKAEGKLTPAMHEDESALNFGTSVDSQGFHHARAPSISDSPDEIRKYDLHINPDEDFENVNASDALGDETKDDSDEKGGLVGEPQERKKPTEEKGDENAPSKPARKSITDPEKTSSALASALQPTADQADSPTSAGLTERLGSVELDTDTVMRDIASEQREMEAKPLLSTGQPTAPQSLGKGQDLSPHPEDKPAPLFSGRKSPTKADPEEEETTEEKVDEQKEQPSNDAETGSILLADGEEAESNTSPFSVDVDGTPVVGDLLKIMFVDHKVVPTVLVSSERLDCRNALTKWVGFLLPISLEQLPPQCSLRRCPAGLQRPHGSRLQSKPRHRPVRKGRNH